jgi:outer membrane receptor for ferrienterochelin and colicins
MNNLKKLFVNFLFIGKNLKIFSIIILLPSILIAQSGSLSGNISDSETGEKLIFVNVRLENSTIGTASNENGDYLIENIAPGTYIVVVTAVGYETLKKEVVIIDVQVTRENFLLAKQAIEFNEVMVYGASLKRERITEAPASVTVLGVEEIKRNSGHSQLARLLENTTGVDIAQSSLFDFNINVRGFNSSLNRRLLILLDGRDLGTAFLGATEWNALSTPLEDLGRIELVRGPGSALYGANAYNGVINISSIPPKENVGTRITLTGGENSSLRGDIKYANIAGNWSYRFNFGGYQGRSFGNSRKGGTFEYQGLHPVLNNEVVDLITDPIRSIFGSGRLDYEFDDKGILTLEGGYTQVENEVIVTGIGRVQVQNAGRPWGRINYNGHGFNVLFWTNGRINNKPEKSLATGLDLIQNALITHGEAQYNFTALQQKLFVVLGISQRFVNIDTHGTLMQEKRNDNTTGIYSQIEYKFVEDIKVVLAARWDRSTLHSNRISPKAAIVWNPVINHSFRVTFNKAFQPANYSEQYLDVKRPPSPGATSSVRYLGNPDLVPEEITGYELGYKGIYNNQMFLTLDIYYNKLKNFITDLGPTGRNYFDLEDQITYAYWSYGNAGKVNEYGFDLGTNFYLNDSWIFNANFSLFRFDVIEKGSNDILLPNTPEYKVNGGITYIHPAGHSAEINIKYIPTFPWAAGIFRDANIPQYTIVSFSGTYKISQTFSLNLNVHNLLDNIHYEILGGSLLRRRALLSLIVTI